jgi:hypothetical protein
VSDGGCCWLPEPKRQRDVQQLEGASLSRGGHGQQLDGLLGGAGDLQRRARLVDQGRPLVRVGVAPPVVKKRCVRGAGALEPSDDVRRVR